MLRKTVSGMLAGAVVMALAGSAMAQDRVSATQKGSLLIFSKVEIKWDADGNLIQDTFVDVSNDYPADVHVQAYFINGDAELEEICSGEPCSDNIIQAYEPGWNTADCRFVLTADQPHFWSAAHGSNKCQAFTVLDDGGRPDPETGMTSRVLRGYIIMYAVDFFAGPGGEGSWLNIRWNHLKGDVLVINYADGSAWEYNAWAFQTNAPVGNGQPIGDGETLSIGSTYQSAFDKLLLDFYGTGSTALSGGDQTVVVNTDLTLHAISADLRQDGCGPVLTKVEAEIWNEFETKFSGTRRCICCWDEAMLSDWVRSVAIPNHFTRAALRTDKGKARLDGVESTECDYEALCGPTAVTKRKENYEKNGIIRCDRSSPAVAFDRFDELGQSEEAALLGVVAKFLDFDPSGDKALAGMNLVGMGTDSAEICVDPMVGPDEARDEGRTSTARDVKGVSSGRDATSRGTVEIPAE